jgi:hypothetical protein
MTAEPGTEAAAGALGRGHLRASHADREQVIGMLKIAFVQGRLSKDELDARVGKTLAARTYADLAAITADLPAGLIAVRPSGKPAPARTRPPVGKVVAGAALIVPPPAMVGATILTGSDFLAAPTALVVVIFFMAWMVAGAQILVNWRDKRSRRQLPPQQLQRGQALEGEQDGGIGNGLTPFGARRAVRAPHLPGMRLSSATGGL